MRITTNPIVGGGYEAPEIEVITTTVEGGFSLSFGDEGEAGASGEYRVDNYGDF